MLRIYHSLRIILKASQGFLVRRWYPSKQSLLVEREVEKGEPMADSFNLFCLLHPLTNLTSMVTKARSGLRGDRCGQLGEWRDSANRIIHSCEEKVLQEKAGTAQYREETQAGNTTTNRYLKDIKTCVCLKKSDMFEVRVIIEINSQNLKIR